MRAKKKVEIAKRIKITEIPAVLSGEVQKAGENEYGEEISQKKAG